VEGFGSGKHKVCKLQRHHGFDAGHFGECDHGKKLYKRGRSGTGHRSAGLGMSGPDQPKDPKIKVYSSEELFGTENKIFIKHGEILYRLLVTRQGKLVLNK